MESNQSHEKIEQFISCGNLEFILSCEREKEEGFRLRAKTEPRSIFQSSVLENRDN